MKAFSFIDGHEVNLHPAWQVQIADDLFEIASRSVYVVIATYSLNIIKWLEVYVNKNSEDKALV